MCTCMYVCVYVCMYVCTYVGFIEEIQSYNDISTFILVRATGTVVQCRHSVGHSEREYFH